VVVDRDQCPQLLLQDRQLSFTSAGWDRPIRRPRIGQVQVLTPPTSVAALTNGYTPVLHPTALA
jgi:hypothetical protein